MKRLQGQGKLFIDLVHAVVVVDDFVEDDLTTKTCTTCNLVKDLSKFTKDGRGGIRNKCRLCERDAKISHKYKLTPEEFHALLAAQCYTCAVCDDRFGRANVPCVDHDHSCCPGEVGCGRCNRGLVCHRCNKILGLASDDPDLLERAVEYLNRGEL